MKYFVLILVLFSYHNCYAQLAVWNFTPRTQGNEIFSYATLVDPGVDMALLSRGRGLMPQKATFSFASTWPDCDNMIDAVRKCAYYQFSIKVARGYVLAIDSISMVLRVQEDAPHNYVVTYSNDGETFTDIGKPVHIKTTVNDGEQQPVLDLSEISDMKCVESRNVVTFRIYAWGNDIKSGSSTAFRIGKSTTERHALAIYGKSIKIKTKGKSDQK